MESLKNEVFVDSCGESIGNGFSGEDIERGDG
jgi:hypothetical protein